MPRITGSTFFNGSYLFIDYGVSQNIPGNYSDVSYIIGFHYGNAHFRLDNAQCTWSATGGVSGGFHGGPVSTGWPAPGGKNMDVGLFAGSFRAHHTNDGNCTVSVVGSISSDFGGSNINTSFALDQIPRLPGAPGAPSATGHTDSNPTTFTVNWTAPSDVGAGLSGYRVQVSRQSNFSSIDFQASSNSSWTTSFSVTGAQKGTTYYARVAARTSAGQGPWSNTGSWTTGTTAPGAPGTPSISGVTSSQATATWSAPSDTGGTSITGYRVERSTTSNFSSGVVGANLPASPRSLQFTGLAHTTQYWVRVRAINSRGNSEWSSIASFTTSAGPPGKPGAPTISNRGPNGATATWTAPSSNGGASITGYQVAWSTNSNFSPEQTATGSSLSRNIAGLTPSSVYYVRVRAINSAGPGPYSDTVQFRTTSGTKVGSSDSWQEADIWFPNSSGNAWRAGRFRVSQTGTGWQ